MFVKPAPGVEVRDPVTRQHLPPAGAEVPETTYWRRRLRAGDVVAGARVTEPAADRPAARQVAKE